MAKRKTSLRPASRAYAPLPSAPLSHVEILHDDLGVAVYSKGRLFHRAKDEDGAKAWAWDNRGEL